VMVLLATWKKVRFDHWEVSHSPLKGTNISHALVRDKNVPSTFLNKKLIIQRKKIKMSSMSLKIYQKNLCERTKMPSAVWFIFYLFLREKNILILYSKKQKKIQKSLFNSSKFFLL
jgi:hypothetical protein